MKSRTLKATMQLPIFAEQLGEKRRARTSPAEYEALSRVRLSKNFILRPFLFSTEAAALGLSNYPDRPDLVIAAGRALCNKILEPVLEQFGNFAITFGHQCHQAIETGKLKSRKSNPRSSSPHQWDRQTFGDEVYARVDILPFCVADGEVSKHEFAHWLMHSLDVDLLMTWTRSNGFCISISPKPRRVWFQWGNAQMGEPRREVFMGAEYWQRIYPTLPEPERPKFAPSHTDGRITWTGRY
jgi:hypothetical protein